MANADHDAPDREDRPERDKRRVRRGGNPNDPRLERAVPEPLPEQRNGR